MHKHTKKIFWRVKKKAVCLFFLLLVFDEETKRKNEASITHANSLYS